MRRDKEGPICPCCRRPFDTADVYFDTERNVIGTPLGEASNLSPTEGDIAYVLWSARAPVKLLALFARVYGRHEPNIPESEWRPLPVLISRLRKKISRVGLHISPGYHAGYTMTYEPDRPYATIKKDAMRRPVHRPL